MPDTGRSEAEKIALLNSHPRIGADPASLSAASRAEQGADEDAGVGAPAEQKESVLRELAELNDAYERRFGFRFVVFVHGRDRADLIPVLRERLERTRDEELATGINEYRAIERDRRERRR